MAATMQKSLVTCVRHAGRVPSRARVSVAAHASADDTSRRAVLGGVLAGVAALTVGSAEAASQSWSPVELVDDRDAKAKGYEYIYQARDWDLPQGLRDGTSQARSSLADTKARVQESEKRIDNALMPSVKKNYWTEAREELRRQVGTLRFDLNTLADAKGTKAEKKQALALRRSFLEKVEALDFALRQKNEDKATQALNATTAALDSVLSFVL